MGKTVANCGVSHCRNIALRIPIVDMNSTKHTKIAILRALGFMYRMSTPPAIVPTAIVATDVAPFLNEKIIN